MSVRGATDAFSRSPLSLASPVYKTSLERQLRVDLTHSARPQAMTGNCAIRPYAATCLEASQHVAEMLTPEDLDGAFIVMYTVAASLRRRPLEATLSAHCRPRPRSLQLGGVPLAVVRSGDPPSHSRGRRRFR
jgi:hypothetical protein